MLQGSSSEAYQFQESVNYLECCEPLSLEHKKCLSLHQYIVLWSTHPTSPMTLVADRRRVMVILCSSSVSLAREEHSPCIWGYFVSKSLQHGSINMLWIWRFCVNSCILSCLSKSRYISAFVCMASNGSVLLATNGNWIDDRLEGNLIVLYVRK